MKTYIKINDKVWGTYLSRNYIGLKDIKVLNHRVTPKRSSRKDVDLILKMRFGQLHRLRIFSCNMRSSNFQLTKPIALDWPDSSDHFDIEFI